MQHIPTLRLIYFRVTRTRYCQLFFQFLKRIEVTVCSSYDPVVILPKSMDCFVVVFFFFFFFGKNGILVKNAYLSEQVKSMKISTKIKPTILIYENEGWSNWHDGSKTMFMIFNRLPEKEPQFQKIWKLQTWSGLQLYWNSCCLKLQCFF